MDGLCPSRAPLHNGPVEAALGRRAAEIAAQQHLRGPDACYVAASEECEATLVTWDQEMLNRGAAVVETQTPEQWLDARSAD